MLEKLAWRMDTRGSLANSACAVAMACVGGEAASQPGFWKTFFEG